VPQANRAPGDGLDRAGIGPDRHDIANSEGVLEEEMQPVDQILDERLGAKSDRHSHHARTGQQRANVGCDRGAAG